MDAGTKVEIILTGVGLLISVGFNGMQIKWRRDERAQHAKEMCEIKREQREKERTPPEMFNFGGTPHPILITGSRYSDTVKLFDLSGTVSLVNPTHGHMKIVPVRLTIEGEDWPVQKFEFHLKSNPRDSYDRVSLMGNIKTDYELHMFFPENQIPRAVSGELWIDSSNRPDEPIAIPIRFA